MSNGDINKIAHFCLDVKKKRQGNKTTEGSPAEKWQTNSDQEKIGSCELELITIFA